MPYNDDGEVALATPCPPLESAAASYVGVGRPMEESPPNRVGGLVG